MIASGNDGMVMPVTPMMGGYGGAGFGGDWSSWILLFLIFGMFGFGGNGFGGGGNQGANPWLLAANQRTDDSVQAGFNQAALTGQLGGIQSSISDVTQQLYTNQISDLERSFASQTANSQAISGIASQLAQCCCDNRLATSQTQAIVSNEANATRFADANNTRDIIDANSRGVQAILDKLCTLELEGYKRENDNLRQQLNMATLAASQNAQTSAIQAGQRALANEVEQYVLPTPRPAYVVQNPNCCAPYGCGCGMV